MTTILKKMILAVLNAAIRRVRGTAPNSTATTDISTSTKTTRSGMTKVTPKDAASATEPASSVGAQRKAADGNGLEKNYMKDRKTRVAIMLKAGRPVAVIALDVYAKASDGSFNHAVGRMDPRCEPSQMLNAFKTAEIAEESFNETLAVSRDNGWTIAHIGERNFG